MKRNFFIEFHWIFFTMINEFGHKVMKPGPTIFYFMKPWDPCFEIHHGKFTLTYAKSYFLLASWQFQIQLPLSFFIIAKDLSVVLGWYLTFRLSYFYVMADMYIWSLAQRRKVDVKLP